MVVHALLELARRDAAEVQVRREHRRPASEVVVALAVVVDQTGEELLHPRPSRVLAGRQRRGQVELEPQIRELRHAAELHPGRKGIASGAEWTDRRSSSPHVRWKGENTL